MTHVSISSLSPIAAFIFTFNLIIGVGALSLPLAFSTSGIIGSCILLIVLAGLAFISTTYVIETLSIANFINKLKSNSINNININNSNSSTNYKNKSKESSKETLRDSKEIDLLDKDESTITLISETSSSNTSITDTSIINYNKSPYDIDLKFELGELTSIFLGTSGTAFLYFVLSIYLYGDLLIYAVSVPTTLSTYFGGFSIGSLEVSIESSYYVFLLIFACVVLPFCFISFTNTKVLQLVCMFTRNLALLLMIILAIIRISQGEYSPASELPMFHYQSLPSLFGTSIYAFMCHHSLPSIITPMTDKCGLSILFFWIYALVLVIYITLCVSANYAFPKDLPSSCPSNDGPPCRIQALYSLNFSSYHIRVIADFITLFPVFTLTSTFPIIAHTLSNNLRALYNSLVDESSKISDEVVYTTTYYSYFFNLARRNIFVLVSTIPPFFVAFLSQNLKSMINLTGSFAGLFIQYLIPCALVYYARLYITRLKSFEAVKTEFEETDTVQYQYLYGTMLHRRTPTNPLVSTNSINRNTYESIATNNSTSVDMLQQYNIYTSPFSSQLWVYAMVGWSIISLCLTIFNLICDADDNCKSYLN